MTTHLVIGGDGFLGKALARRLRDGGETDVVWTTRRRDWTIAPQGSFFFDLLSSDPGELPPCDIVYLVAANTKIAECERDPTAWRVNVDAPIAIAKRFMRERLFGKSIEIVYLSSDAVETCSGTAYGRQKAAAEAYMHAIDATIIRPGRIPPERVDDLADIIIAAGLNRRRGVIRWQA